MEEEMEGGLCFDCDGICKKWQGRRIEQHNFQELCRFLKADETSYPKSWYVERLSIKELSATSVYEAGKRVVTSNNFPDLETKYRWSFEPQQESSEFGVDRCVLCRFIEQVAKRYIANKNEFRNSEICQYQLRSYVSALGDVSGKFGQVHKSLGLSVVYRRPGSVLKREKAIVCLRGSQVTVPQPGDCRIRPLKANVRLFKDWLQCCEKNHQMFCVPVLREETFNYRLIDVRKQCIVDKTHQVADQHHRIRYITLSYVWGTRAPDLVLNSTNDKELHKPGALNVHKPSRTISDAIHLVEGLGERYLWVDALCIKQDDATDLAYAIPKMGQIYQLAVLTIVAAAGRSSEAQLPGLDDGTRHYEQAAIECGGLRLMTAAVPPLFSPDGPCENSSYNQRAWTFQERLLSVRCLIFTPEQVYWECRSRSWSEDTVTFDDGLYNAGGMDPLKLPSLQSIPKPLLMKTLVSQYTAREMSFSKDALNAFTGILSLYNAIYLEQFFWALATSDFCLQLLWRSSSDNFRDGLKTGLDADFPTWSWLPWSGRITLFPVETRGVGRSDTHIPYYRLDETGSQLQVQRILGPGQADHVPDQNVSNHTARWQGHGDKFNRWRVNLGEIQQLQPVAKFRPNFHIFFWTWSVTITVDHGVCEFKSAQSTSVSRTARMPVHGVFQDRRPECGGACEYVYVGEEALLHIHWESGFAIRRGFTKLVRSAQSTMDFTWKMIVLG